MSPNVSTTKRARVTYGSAKADTVQANVVAAAVARTLFSMGNAPARSTGTNVVPVSTSKDKMSALSIICMKEWCRIKRGVVRAIPKIWKELELETTKEDKMERLARAFSPEEIDNDTVDIHIDNRLAQTIAKGRFGAGLNYSYECTLVALLESDVSPLLPRYDEPVGGGAGVRIYDQ